MPTKIDRDHLSFERQAPLFAARTELDDAVELGAADAVLQLGGLAADDLLQEIGAGTGEIGRFLAAAPPRCIGLDSSPAMLAEFTPRLPEGADAMLIEADANRTWPLDDNAAALILGSRVFHLLDGDHLLAEARRVGRHCRFLLLADRVRRAHDALKDPARQKMRALLEAHGETPRSTERRRRALWDRAAELAGAPITPVAAARWPVTATVADAVAAWRAEDSLGGVTPPAAVRPAVLDELDRWAEERSDAGRSTSEGTCILESLRFAAEGASA